LNIAAAGVLANDSDPDGDSLTALLDVAPAHGAVMLNADGSFTYTPDAGFSGMDSFTYLVSDGGATTPATVSIKSTPCRQCSTTLTISMKTACSMPRRRACSPTTVMPTAIRCR
jgi:VCBS repeat-containing protein